MLAALVLCAGFVLLHGSAALAQSSPTASRDVEPSVFAGLTGSYTGLQGSRNAAVTAGINVGLLPLFHILPSVELRGTFPIDDGEVVGQRSAEGGLRISKRYHTVRPYADFLIGRGQLNYQNGGFIVPSQSFLYLESTSTIYSPGVGAEIDLRDHLALMLDGQLQHWDIPFSTSGDTSQPGHLWSKVGTVGVVYRFSWLEHGHPAP